MGGLAGRAACLPGGPRPPVPSPRSASGYFRRAAALRICPGHAAAFNTGDAFLRPLVEAEFIATSTQGSRGHESGAPPVVAAVAAAASGATMPGGSTLAARLLLEWGLAQVRLAAARVLEFACPRPPSHHHHDPTPPHPPHHSPPQHFFGRESAAKTSFFLAKRETGLRTELTGALGRRTKFQTFDVAQLILRAASVGAQAAAAVTDALRADELGAARGRFGVDALRKEGLLGAAAADAAKTTTAAEAAVPLPAASLGPDEPLAAEGSAGEQSAGAAAAASSASIIPVLGGVTTVTLDEADADNILLEQVCLGQCDAGRVIRSVWGCL